jgi:hypothetical protein
MLSAREVIDDIRRTEFGIGESDAIPAIRNLRAKLHRALQQLSEDIYADGIHFVLELVQNAEDNEYGAATPELRFVLSDSYLQVLNNETGFGEASARAVCDVSRSTKTKAKGHIGEKGIGFKSVFRITAEPRIFSNGYQFRLPKHDPGTGLGYVVPFWVDDVPAQVVPGVTNILLPLNADATDELAKVADIRPSLLLFLKQLRSVTVEDRVRGRETQISRSGDDRRLELRSAAGVESWTLVRRTLPVRADIREEKRKDVTHTELAVALPRTAEGDADGTRFHPVHAYLPIDDYGLRFAFHADFVLATGREGITTYRPWNVWLRDSLPELFLAAVEVCKKDERLRTSFLAYVPRPDDDVDGFFVDTAEAIRDGLRKTPCVLTESGGWALPSEVLIADDAVHALLSSADALELLGKEFVARTFRADAALLIELGAAAFTLDDLVACLRSEDWVAKHSDDWFARLFAHLGAQDLDEHMEELRELQFVPLESGGLTSLAAARGGVFFPPSRHRKYGFESGLLVVRRGVLGSAEKGQTVAVTEFLRQLGVKQASPLELIREHMIPLFADEDWRTTRDDDFRHGCVEYVKDHWEECRKSPALASKLRATLWVRIEGSGNVYARPGWMYLPPAYGNTHPLKAILRDIDDIHFVDPVYLERAIESLKQRKARAKRGKVSRGDRKRVKDEWRSFFVDLGVETGIRVKAAPNDQKPNEADSPDLAKVMKTKEADRIALALSVVDAEWDRYARLTTTKWLITQGRGRVFDAGSVRTAFGSLLTDSAWIPVAGGGLAKPGEVFCDTPGTRELLGDRVSYLAAPLTTAAFLDALGIHRGPTLAAVLGRLRHLVRAGVRERAGFEPLYTFLQDHYHEDSAAVDAAFWKEALILVPEKAPRVVSADQAFWKDVSALFGDERGYLEPVYHQLKKFFRAQLEVREVPTLEDYGDRLVELAEGGSLDAASEPTVWAIYREFDRRMRERSERDAVLGADWWDDFIDRPVFLGEDGGFVEYGEVVANDSEELAAPFRGRPGVTFFKAAADRLPQVRHFLRGAGVRFLSQAVKHGAVVPPASEFNATLTDQLRLLTPFLLRYLHHRESDLYDRFKASGKLGRLEALRAQTCTQPRARLTLGAATVEIDRPAVVADDTLYVRADALEDADSVAIALATWLGNPKGLEDFLVSLLEKRDTERIRRFLCRKGIPELPGEETEAIGEALRSAEFGTSTTSAEAQPPGTQIAVGAAVGVAIPAGASSSPAPFPSPPARPPQSGPGEVVPSSNGASVSSPPLVPGRTSPTAARAAEGRDPARVDRGGTPGPQRTSPPPPRPPAAPAARPSPPPVPSAPAAPAPAWQQCRPGEALVSWGTFEPVPRPARPIPAPPVAGPPPSGGQPGGGLVADHTPAPDSETDDPPDVRCEVGRWGEAYTLACLRAELCAKHPGAVAEETTRGFRLRSGGNTLAEVVWLNCEGERGVGYDIEVTEGVSRLFVEVKSTRDDAKAVFDLSDAQWELARAQGPAYRITRVYNAGRSDARAVNIADPHRAWQAGELMVRSLRIML